MAKHPNKYEYIKFNNNRSQLEGKFSLDAPHCYHITSDLFFTTEEEDAQRILASVVNRFKTYIKYNMNCLKEICIIDYSPNITQGEKFVISIEYSGLIGEHMTKSLLLDKCERMAMLLEEFTKTLNANMIILTSSSRGNRKK